MSKFPWKSLLRPCLIGQGIAMFVVLSYVTYLAVKTGNYYYVATVKLTFFTSVGGILIGNEWAKRAMKGPNVPRLSTLTFLPWLLLYASVLIGSAVAVFGLGLLLEALDLAMAPLRRLSQP